MVGIPSQIADVVVLKFAMAASFNNTDQNA
jgi:hypothetical protein